MTSSSSLYGTTSTQNSSSSNSTSLYGDAGTPIPDSSGNVIVRGTLTVNGCAILTNCSSFSFLPLNATTIDIGASATSIDIGSSSGTTTINNQLATANYDFPVADGTANQVLVTDGAGNLSFSTGNLLGRTYNIDASTTSGGVNFNLTGSDATTDTIKFASGSGILVTRTNANEIAITNIGVVDPYNIDATATTGGANLNLNSPAGTDTVKFASAGATTVTRTSASVITISSLNTTYTQDVSPVGGGANLNLTGSDASVDPVKFAGGTNVTVTATDAGTITIAATDTNTTYDFNASTATGGANLNLVGSDATTDTVKLTNGGHITATRTSATVVTLGSDATSANTANTIVSRDASGEFSAGGATLGNITVGVVDDNTIATTSGNIVLAPATGIVTAKDIIAATGGAAPTNGLNLYSNDLSSAVHLYDDFVQINSGFPTTADWIFNSDGSTDFPYYKFPSADGTANQILITNGSGILSFTSNPVFGGITAGNITVGVVDDNTISNSIGDLVISATGTNHVVIESGTGSPTTITRTSTGTTTNVRAVVLNSQSTGTPVVGFGTSAEFQVETAPGNTESAGYISVTSTDITPGSEDFKMSFGLMAAGATYTERAFIDSIGNMTLDGDLTVNDAVVFNGATSGSVTIAAPATAGSQSYTLPTALPAVSGYVLSGTTGGVLSWVANPDVNTTYDFNATSTTGGANLNLVGSDATTDTVKLTDGGHITATYTSGTVVTLGSDATDANTASTIVSRNASGNFAASGATLGNVTVGVDTDQIISTTSGNLVLQTAAGVNSGTITINAGAAGNIAIAPNGSGSVVNTFSNGGNLTNNRNYVLGAIRNATTASNGEVFTLGPAGTGFKGISLDNSADTADGPTTILRSFSGGAVAGSGTRGRVIFEKARGTSASPTAVQIADQIGSVEGTGFTTTGWLSDTLAVMPAVFNFAAAENWVSNTNLGTQANLLLAPTATTISSGANLVLVIAANPQAFASRSDSFTWANGKTGSTQTMSLDVSGNLIVTGDVRVNGNDIQASDGATNITLTSNTLTTFAGDIKVNGNNIQNSGGTNAIDFTSANTTTTVRGDTINLTNGGATATNLALASTSATFAASGTAYATFASGSASITNSGRTMITRTSAGTGLLLRQSTAASGPADNDSTDFRLGVTGTVTSSDFARVDGTYKTSGDNEIGLSVSVDSFATDTDRIYIGSRAKTQIQTTPAGGGTAGTTAEFTQLATTIKSNALTLQTAAGVALVGTAVSYNRVLGQAQFDATITPAAANTAAAFTVQGGSAVTDFANILTFNNTSRIQPNAVGMFNLQFSAQLQNTDNGADHTAYIWFRKNGVDVTGSMGRVYVTKQHQTIGGWNGLIQTTATSDYFELMYAVDNTALIFPFFAATAFGPSTAAVIISVTPVGA